MKALILAGGKGIRMMPLTEDKPKAMVLLKGKPLLEHSLKAVEKAGIEECGIVLGKFGEKVKRAFGDKHGEMKLKYFHQEKPLGTAHAVATAEEWLDEDFLLLSADVLIESSLLRELAEKRGFAGVLTIRHDDFPEHYGVVSVDGKQVTGIVEKPWETAADSLVNAGVYRLSPKIFGAIRKTGRSTRGEFELTDALKILMSEGEKIGFVKLKGKCMDLGSISDLEKAEKSDL